MPEHVEQVPGANEQALRAEIVRLNKVIQALMNRAERNTSLQGSDFNLFHTAITLEDQVRRRTDELEEARLETEKITRALREREHHFRSLIENVQDIITVIDARGTIGYMSPAAERILGRPPEEFVGKSVFDCLHPDDTPVVQAAMRHVMGSPESPRTSLIRLRHEDGSWRAMEVIGKLLAGEGSPQIVVNSRDVTDSQVLEEQLRESQKMEAVGRLAGGIAHDFNNLLTVISGNAELLLSDARAEDPKRGALTDIRKASDRAASLTRQLLAFGRKQILEPRLVDVNVVVAGIEKMLRRLIGEDVELAADLAADPGWVKVDPGQLEQVVVNLALNARDAMPRGGRITIRSWNLDAVEPMSVEEAAGQPLRRKVAISISDTGTGIAPELKAHLFEPFFTTKEFGKGSGLGLATVHGIVKQSGGEITVQSEPGKGATFTVVLPSQPAPRPKVREVLDRQG